MKVSKLLLMLIFHFIAMYLLMFAMVNQLSNVFLNLRQHFSSPGELPYI